MKYALMFDSVLKVVSEEIQIKINAVQRTILKPTPAYRNWKKCLMRNSDKMKAEEYVVRNTK